MTYDSIKNYITNRLEGLGYSESKQPFTFENASTNEFNNSFIVLPLEGSVDPDGANLNISIFDTQLWEVSLAFSKSANNDLIQRDEMNRAIEPIIVDLDNPTNYSATVDLIEYQSWSVEENDLYFLLKINFIIRTQYNY